MRSSELQTPHTVRRIFNMYRQAYSGLSKGTWLIAFVSLVNRSGSMVLVFLALYLQSELGYAVDEAGRVLALYGIGAICGMMFAGRMIDRIGPVPIQAAGLCGMGVGFYILGQVETPGAIAAVVFVTSAVGESFRPASVACLAGTCTPATRTKSFALNRLAINLGVAISPVVGGYLAAKNYGLLFTVDAVTCIVAAIILLACRGTLRQETNPPDSEPVAKRSPWSDRQFLVGLLLLLMVAIIFMQMASTLPIYLKGVYGFGTEDIGWLFAINPILIVIFEMIIVHGLADRPPLRIVRWGVLLVGLGFALMPLGSGFIFAGFTVAIWSFGEMLESPFMATFVADRAGSKSRGGFMALYMSVYGLAFVLAPLLGSAVYERWGPDVLWFGCGVLGLITALGFSILAARVTEKKQA